MTDVATLTVARVADRLLVSISRNNMSLAVLLTEDEVSQWKEALDYETGN